MSLHAPLVLIDNEKDLMHQVIFKPKTLNYIKSIELVDKYIKVFKNRNFILEKCLYDLYLFYEPKI